MHQDYAKEMQIVTASFKLITFKRASGTASGLLYFTSLFLHRSPNYSFNYSSYAIKSISQKCAKIFDVPIV
jgi:hypothetical protein